MNQTELAAVVQAEDWREPGRLGVGEFPQELAGLNWTVVLWGGLWALFQGIWKWFALFTAIVVISAGLSVRLSRSDTPAPVLIASSAVTLILTFSVTVSLARRANRLVWERERRRLDLQSDQSVPRPSATVRDYLASQKKWLRYGIFFLALSTPYNLWQVRMFPDVMTQSAIQSALHITLIIALFVYERALARS